MWTYIMVGFSKQYDEFCFAEYRRKENFIIRKNTANHVLTEKIQKLCCSEIINKYIEIPFKSVWMNTFKDLGLKREDKICFIFSKAQSWLLSYKDGMYIKLLRETYPNCKIILYLRDLIQSYYRFDAEFFKCRCDGVLSYDEGDAQKYGLIYCPVPYAKVETGKDEKDICYDVFFCGKAKDRLQDIYEVYEYLKANNLRIKFIVTDVAKQEQKYSDDIIFNKKISYTEYLSYVNKSNCILEICQKNSRGDTLRVKEAITYGKKLVTNNQDIKNRPYYKESQILVYDRIEEIDTKFYCQEIMEKEQISYSFEYLTDVLEKICT